MVLKIQKRILSSSIILNLEFFPPIKDKIKNLENLFISQMKTVGEEQNK